MKKPYLYVAIIGILVVGGGFLLLKNQSSTSSTTQNELAKQEEIKTEESAGEAMMGIGYILKNGKMMVEENHQFNPMTAGVTFENGTTVSTTGLVTKSDGSSFTLAEGQSMWTDGTFMEASEEAQADSKTSSTDSGISSRYIDYSEKSFVKASENNGRAVLWFAALAWCPSCQAADKDFKANFNKVPSDITILKVNYDTEKSMKQKYAITMQDTFVQVDSQGKEITRWNSGGQGVGALLANAK